MGKWFKTGALIGAIAIAIAINKRYAGALGLDKDAALRLFQQWSDRLGIWALPLYVALHTVTLSLCLPYAIFFEAGASLLFGFFPGVLCVFSAKLLGASLSFWIGRSALSFFWFIIIELLPEIIYQKLVNNSSVSQFLFKIYTWTWITKIY